MDIVDGAPAAHQTRQPTRGDCQPFEIFSPSFQYIHKNVIFRQSFSWRYMFYGFRVVSPVAEAPAKRSRAVRIIMPSYMNTYRPWQKKFIAGTKAEHDHAFLDRFRSVANSQLHWLAVAQHSRLGSSRSPFGFWDEGRMWWLADENRFIMSILRYHIIVIIIKFYSTICWCEYNYYTY